MGLQQTVCTVVSIKCIFLESKPKITPEGKVTGTEFFFQSDQYIPTMGLMLNCADILKQMAYEKRIHYNPNIKFTISTTDLTDPTESIEELLEVKKDSQCILSLGLQTDMIPRSEKSRGVAYAKMTYISIKTGSSSNGKTNSTSSSATGKTSSTNTSTTKTSTGSVGYSSTVTS